MNTLNKTLTERAIELANRPYIITIDKDTLTDGQEIVLISHPELPGCMAQGIDENEAMANLNAVRFEYILALLESGLSENEIAEPMTVIPFTEARGDSKLWIFDASIDEIDAVLDAVVKPDYRDNVLSIALQGDLVEHR